jgi:hypothetical protein
MSIKKRVHGALHRFGLDVVPYNGTYLASRRRVEILGALAADLRRPARSFDPPTGIGNNQFVLRHAPEPLAGEAA